LLVREDRDWNQCIWGPFPGSAGYIGHHIKGGFMKGSLMQRLGFID
jgi:hypothetical protein